MELVLKPIGFIHSSQLEPYQASRQPDSLRAPAIIEVNNQYLQGLQDLNGCSHIWLIFGFHHNENWKPLVQTPRSDRKIGVFATRAPYRPNPLGLSCVSLISIEKNILQIGPNDLLDGTPIYDIKPYLSEYDSITETQISWLKTSTHKKMKITFSPTADDELDFLKRNGLKELRPFITRQLEYDPTNASKKRVEKNSSYWTLSYRTWRVDFLSTDDTIGIMAIRSGYSEDEIANPTDPYLDKSLHQKFIQFIKI